MAEIDGEIFAEPRNESRSALARNAMADAGGPSTPPPPPPKLEELSHLSPQERARIFNQSRAAQQNFRQVAWRAAEKKSKNSGWFRYSQILAPLLPIPLGCYLLYKAIVSFNRTPPPIATDSETVLNRPLYAEPVYQRVSIAPSTIMRNMTPRGGWGS